MIKTFSLLALTLVFTGMTACSQPSPQKILVQDINPEAKVELEALKRELNVSTIRDLKDQKSEIWQIPKGKEDQLQEAIRSLKNAQELNLTALQQDYRQLFVRPSQSPQLSEAQNRLLEHMKSEKIASGRVSLFELNEMPFVLHGLTKGFDQRDGFPDRGTLKIQLSPEEQLSVVKTESSLTDGGYIWKGSVKEKDGDVMLLANGDSITGSLNLKGKVYSIRPLGKGMHAVIEKRTDAFPDDHPPRFQKTAEEANQARDMPPSPPLDRNERVDIDLLVAYTKRVTRIYHNVENDLIRLALAELNASVRQSSLGRIRFRLVHSYETKYEETGNWDDHLIKIKPEINQKRQEHSADIGILIVDDGDYCGEAAQIRASKSKAFCVVHHNCATGYYSFGHEIGHLFGARHDRYVDNETTPFPYGHGFLNGNQWR
ncbi:MAG: M12 family metallo-peptidase, partial [Verrucomicrobiota bacterium]